MNLLVMGLQWGDEGKGKTIDYLAGDYNVVVRYQGGHNAGHTIYYQGNKVVLHLLPSGIFSPGTLSVIAQGVVINPIQLVNEIKHINTLCSGSENLSVSANAPIILPFHQELDIVFENSRFAKIGTTRRGIGPAYEDLTGRRAVFLRDLRDRKTFYDKVAPLSEYYNKLIQSYGGSEINLDSYADEYCAAGEFLRKFMTNTTTLLNKCLKEDKRILFEGAQGVLLDINHGTYPYVTSSNPTIGGVLTGTGLSHKALKKVTGISKAYTTRVGEGPFPSELRDDEADLLRAKGNEYGATTGRPRRVGWLDLVALKYAVMINGIDSIFLTKLDVLDGFEHVKAVTEYDYEGHQSQEFDPYLEYLSQVKPVLKSFPGWLSDTSACISLQALPSEARNFIKFIEDYIEVPIEYISVGSSREQTIRCRNND